MKQEKLLKGQGIDDVLLKWGGGASAPCMAPRNPQLYSWYLLQITRSEIQINCGDSFIANIKGK